MQPKRGKDFRELIVKGERPEMTAFLVAAIDFVRKSHEYSSVRWGDADAEEALVQEDEIGGRIGPRV